MYDAPRQFEPLMPQMRLGEAQRRAGLLADASLELAGNPHPTTLESIQQLVRSMNSYYSNRIEGQSTSPINIERALHKNFSQTPEVARLQRLAVAHIDAEKELEGIASQQAPVLTAGFVVLAHAALYGRLAVNDRTTKEGDIVVPGQIRQRDVEVEVGRHAPPSAQSLPRFLKRFDEVYGVRQSWDLHIVQIACAHHRIAWIHPFLDGNGRATRLQTHCALWPLSKGLWSVNRGLARRRDQYYAALANADQPRRSDLDGRGNLTDAGLFEWVEYFLSVCEDQVEFMKRMLNLEDFKRRLEAMVIFRSTRSSKGPDRMRQEAVLPLHYAFTSGSMTRAEFTQMTGLGERTARTLLSLLLKQGLLVSDSAYGPVRLGLPLDALQFLFPSLYPEAAQADEP